MFLQSNEGENRGEKSLLTNIRTEANNDYL